MHTRSLRMGRADAKLPWFGIWQGDLEMYIIGEPVIPESAYIFVCYCRATVSLVGSLGTGRAERFQLGCSGVALQRIS